MFVEAVLGIRHWVIGHRLAVILTGAFGTRIGGTEKRFVYRNCIWIQKGVATGNGWLGSELGVFSHMSCEFELFMTTVV